MNARDFSSTCVPVLGLAELEQSFCPDLFGNFSGTSHAFVPISACLHAGAQERVSLENPILETPVSPISSCAYNILVPGSMYTLSV